MNRFVKKIVFLLVMVMVQIYSPLTARSENSELGELASTPVDVQIMRILRSSVIISLENKDALENLVRQLSQSFLDEKSLKTILDDLIIRVQSDLQALHSVLNIVEELSKDRFGRTIAKVSEKEISRLREQWEEVSLAFQDARPDYRELAKFSRQNYLDNIKRNSDFLVRGHASTSALFDKVKIAIKPAYDQWNKKYAALSFDGEEIYQDDVNRPLQYDERKFAQVFARLQTLFRRLTDVNSQEF
jgi:hypothetical protein